MGRRFLLRKNGGGQVTAGLERSSSPLLISWRRVKRDAATIRNWETQPIQFADLLLTQTNVRLRIPGPKNFPEPIFCPVVRALGLEPRTL